MLIGKRKTRFDITFDVINYVILALVAFIMIYPMYFCVIASFSDPTYVHLGKTYFVIKGFHLEAYRNVFRNKDIWRDYMNSIFITSCATAWSLAMTVPCAYALSRKNLKGRGILMTYFMITMYFGGGLIPSYLVNKTLHLVNTYWVLIMGFGVHNMILVRTFYRTNFPDELYEAAKIDGCSEIGIFLKIAIPLSGAIIAVIALYCAVGNWNAYFSALIYISDKKKWPLQLVLRSILILNSAQSIDAETMRNATMEQLDALVLKQRLAETMKYSVIFISSLPMLIAYPFVQKYFVKGVMIGSLKG